MPLVADDVRQILEAAIVSARFANADVAPQFANTLAGPVTEGLNAILAPADQVDTETEMTISDALTLRNELAKVVSTATAAPISEGHAREVAERLLLANLVDVGGVWHRVSSTVATGLIQLTTGQHAAQPAPTSTGPNPYPVRIPTGSTPAQDPAY